MRRALSLHALLTVYILPSDLRILFNRGIDNSPIDNFDNKWIFYIYMTDDDIDRYYQYRFIAANFKN